MKMNNIKKISRHSGGPYTTVTKILTISGPRSGLVGNATESEPATIALSRTCLRNFDYVLLRNAVATKILHRGPTHSSPRPTHRLTHPQLGPGP